MSEDGFIVVLECPDPEQHGPVDYKVLLEQAERERDRWHRAALTMQTERDEARSRSEELEASLSSREAIIRFRTAERDKARAERDEATAALGVKQSHPLTAGNITDEMVDAAVAGREERGWFTSASPEDNRDEMRAIISDALAARRDEEKR